MADQKILIVEDDANIRALLRNTLEDEGFAVVEADTLAMARTIITNTQLDLVTLDIHLGSDSGLELAREMRQSSKVPIIMVTGKDDVIDRVVGLELGADDYITKPFHIREVLARIRSVLRRTVDQEQANAEVTGAYTFDGMVAFSDRMILLDRDGTDCHLTSGEFRLLSIFLERPKRVLSRDQLMDLISGHEWNPTDRTIDNQIARLRKKIERDQSSPQLIKTVRGVGYTFTPTITPCQSAPPLSNA